MRKLIIFILAMLAGPVLILGILWFKKDEVADYWSDSQRITAAPVPQSFADVTNIVVDEGVEVEEVDEGVETVDENPSEDPVAVIPNSSPSSPSDPSTSSNPSSPSTMPVKFNLAVPFTSQAPLSNWDAVHEDACEEASIYMVNAFYEGWPAGKIDPETADTDLLKIVEFEKALFGFFESTTAIQTALLTEQMYGYERVEVIEDPTVDDLKAQIVAGHPVVVLAAGRLLGNPNFTGEGPLYHALVLKGYTETTFVTNDPGTRLGADYQYDFDVIMNALHDWNGGDVLNGKKVVLVIYPNK